MTELINCRITLAELSQIDQLLAHTGQTRSEWLQGLVQAALSETPTNIRNLAERVSSLEQTITHLKNLEQQVEHLTQQMDGQPSKEISSGVSNGTTSPLDRTDISSSSSLASNPSPTDSTQADSAQAPSLPKSVAASTPTPSIYDVEEDEPDEILYDFLEPEASGPSSFRSSSSSGSIYDEEDEPYEILYDFLDPNDQ